MDLFGFFSLSSIVLTHRRVFWEKLQCVKSVDFYAATRPNSVQLLVSISNIYMFMQYKNNKRKRIMNIHDRFDLLYYVP